jgi:hypothetical protein
MKIKDFITLPKSFLHKIFPKLNSIKLLNIDIISNTTKVLNFLVPGTKNNYFSSVLIETDEQITGNTSCKFNCTCDSFKYQYSALLNINNGLINPILKTIKLPKKQNLFICKHLYSTIQIILIHNNIKTLSRIYRIKLPIGEKND